MVEKKSTAIYEDIKKDIISGKIDSRSFLNVGEISEQYHVSKAPGQGRSAAVMRQRFFDQLSEERIYGQSVLQ